MHGLRDGAGRPRVSLAAGQSMVCTMVRGGPGSLPQRSSFPLPFVVSRGSCPPWQHSISQPLSPFRCALSSSDSDPPNLSYRGYDYTVPTPTIQDNLPSQGP